MLMCHESDVLHCTLSFPEVWNASIFYGSLVQSSATQQLSAGLPKTVTVLSPQQPPLSECDNMKSETRSVKGETNTIGGGNNTHASSFSQSALESSIQSSFFKYYVLSRKYGPVPALYTLP